jgi:tRNA U34 5-methylaminomethyl-2-thiouridine-forming methyltransferase MnmC
MEKELILTSDGSHSISIPSMGVTYHSTHGAIQESAHIFIQSCLDHFNGRVRQPPSITIFEMGFGTGLNALLSLLVAKKNQQKIYYEALEIFPLEVDTAAALNYCTQLNSPEYQPAFIRLHQCPWNEVVEIIPYFHFKKVQTSLLDYTTTQVFDGIYFDAFAPDVEPELWTESIFKKLYEMINPGGVLTTYCSKSVVRKAMMAAGWQVEKIPGPPHKREMVRATKPILMKIV